MGRARTIWNFIISAWGLFFQFNSNPLFQSLEKWYIEQGPSTMSMERALRQKQYAVLSCNEFVYNPRVALSAFSSS
jgi:hypothetical protein